MAFVYTALVTIVIELSLHFILKRRNEKEYMKKKDIVDAENIAVGFAFNKQQALDFFYNLAKQKYVSIKRKNYILIDTPKDDLKDNKTILFPAFSLSKFQPQDLVEILSGVKRVNYSKIVILCGDVSKEAYSLSMQITSVKVIILDKFDCYNKLIKEYNYYPENLLELKKTSKLKLKELVAYSLNKKRSKGYFFASIILLFSSFIFRMNLYYIIMSSILLLLSLISFILPKYNVVSSEDIF